MLIVLAVLGILTTIAVQSLGPLTSQAQNEATRRTIDSIRKAVISVNDTSASGTSIVSGYIADTGHLPRVVWDSSTLTGTNDLLIQPTDLGIPAFGDAANGGIVSVPFPQLGNDGTLTGTMSFAWGWRGPYVTPPAASGALIDGWGNPILMHTLTATTSAMQIGAQTISSLPAGGLSIVSSGNPAADTAAHAIDLYGSLTNIAETIPATSWMANGLTGRLFEQDSSGNHNSPSTGSYFTVTLFGAGPNGVTSYLAHITPCRDTSTTTISEQTTGSIDISYAFDGTAGSLVPWVGPHVLYASKSTDGSTFTPAGRAVMFNILPGSSPTIDVRLK